LHDVNFLKRTCPVHPQGHKLQHAVQLAAAFILVGMQLTYNN